MHRAEDSALRHFAPSIHALTRNSSLHRIGPAGMQLDESAQGAAAEQVRDECGHLGVGDRLRDRRLGHAVAGRGAKLAEAQRCGARSARQVRAALNTGLFVAMPAPSGVLKTSLAVEPKSGLAEHGRAIPTTWKRVIRSGRMVRSRVIPLVAQQARGIARGQEVDVLLLFDQTRGQLAHSTDHLGP